MAKSPKPKSKTELVLQPNSRKLLESEIAVSKMVSFLTTVPDPDEMLRKAGIKRYQLRQLELDDEVCQCKDTRVEAVVATPWHLEPNNRVGRWFTAELTDHIEDFERTVLDARFYGYAVHELMLKDTDKGVGIDRVSLKPMEWFAPQTDGSLKYFPDDGSAGTEGLDCDPLKFHVTRCNPSYRNPYGESLLSRLWFPVTWRREGWGMWLQFLETFGEPIILGQMTDYNAFVEAMTKQGVRSTIAWQSISDSDKVTTINASTPGEFDRLENAILRRVQKLILGQTLTSDVGSNGSYAVAAVHNEVRNDKRRADLRMVRKSCQWLVDVLALVNGVEAPTFVLSDDAGLELSRAQRDAVLAPVLAASKVRFSRIYLTNRYDIEEEDLDDIEDAEDPMDALDPEDPEDQEDPSGQEDSATNSDATVSDGPIPRHMAPNTKSIEKKPPVKDRSVAD